MPDMATLAPSWPHSHLNLYRAQSSVPSTSNVSILATGYAITVRSLTSTLKKVPEPLLRAVVSILGFVQFGDATGEFDITAERLGVYRHKEHTGKHSCNCLHEDSDTENYRQPKSQPLCS